MAAAAATTRPVVLELGGNDAAILAPDVAVDAALAARIVDAAFVTSGQVCMAVKRLYVHRDRFDEPVEALAGRLSAEVVGDGLAEGVTMGPVHRPAGAGPRRGAGRRGGRRREPSVLRPGAGAAGGRGGRAGTSCSPALVVAPDPDSRHRGEEQFAPALPVIAYDDLDEAVDAANDTTFGLCASIWSNDEALAAAWPRRLAAGHGLREHPRHLGHRHVRPHGRVEAVRLRGRARGRGHAGLRPPAGPRSPARTAEPVDGASLMRWRPRRDGGRRHGRAAGAGRCAHRRRAGRRHRADGAEAPAADTVIDATGMLVTPGLRRPAHPLRRPAVLGPERQPVPAPRGDHRARRQLRLLAGPDGSGQRRLHLPA